MTKAGRFEEYIMSKDKKSEHSSFCEGIYLDESWASENIQLRIISHKESIQTLSVLSAYLFSVSVWFSRSHSMGDHM